MTIDRAAKESGRWGPYRQASPPPARHRPGARFARRERCPAILSQTTRRVSHVVQESVQVANYHFVTSATGSPSIVPTAEHVQPFGDDEEGGAGADDGSRSGEPAAG